MTGADMFLINQHQRINAININISGIIERNIPYDNICLCKIEKYANSRVYPIKLD